MSNVIGSFDPQSLVPARANFAGRSDAAPNLAVVRESLGPVIEQYVTLHEAVERLGLPYWKLQRAAKRGLVPVYRLLNGRRLVRLSEVVAVVEASREGGSSV